MDPEQKDAAIAVTILVVLVVSVIGGSILIFNPSDVPATTYTVDFNTQPVSTIPDNATVYGQPNLTVTEYNTFRNEILGITLTGTVKQSTLESKSLAVHISNHNWPLEDNIQRLFIRSYRADYLQVDGQYYPVEKSVEQTEVFTINPLFYVWVALLLIFGTVPTVYAFSKESLGMVEKTRH